MAPTTSRSYSVSSASTTNSKSLKCSSDCVAKKKFSCTFPNCGKSFSRSEHLHRHALNHKDGNNTCLRCSAHFRRRDLLDRHMARHKEKDDEAGGEGLGVLATRKRLWRDEDGKIINSRRPSYTTEGTKRQTTRPERKLSKASSISSYDEPATPMTRSSSTASSTMITAQSHIPNFTTRRGESKQKPELQDPDWLSMSTSQPLLEQPQLDTATSPTELSSFDTLYEDTTWPTLSHDNLPTLSTSHSSSSLSSLSSASSPMLSPSSASPHHEYPTPSWSPLPQPTSTPQPQPFQTFMGAIGELPYDDIFKPEASLYDWQAWNSQVLVSKVREEKYDPVFLATTERGEERKGGWLGAEAFRRPFASC